MPNFTPWNSTRSYISSRSANVLSQINSSIPSLNFNITTSSPHTVGGSAATISGRGWINIRNIRIAGDPEPLDLNWTGSNTWQLTVPVAPGQSTVTLEALDFSGNVLDTATGRLLANMADRTCDVWRNPDSGMWELDDVQHYTSSKMGCWQALRDAVHLAELDVIPGEPERWRTEMALIEAWVHEHGWSDDAGAYVMHPGTSDLDASVLLHAESGFDRGERMSRTIDRLTAELGAGPLLYRYTGMDREEHTFVACAFWRASALACVGRHEEALAAMDDLVSRGNDVGIFAEMISEDDGAFWGNLPQALSHLALINAALTMEQLIPAEVLGDR